MSQQQRDLYSKTYWRHQKQEEEQEQQHQHQHHYQQQQQQQQQQQHTTSNSKNNYLLIRSIRIPGPSFAEPTWRGVSLEKILWMAGKHRVFWCWIFFFGSVLVVLACLRLLYGWNSSKHEVDEGVQRKLVTYPYLKFLYVVFVLLVFVHDFQSQGFDFLMFQSITCQLLRENSTRVLVWGCVM